MNALLALCARAEGQSTLYHQLVQQACDFAAWEELSIQAEAHGLGPLLYIHLRAANVSLPLLVQRELQGLFLRHRHANQVRTRVLVEILTAFHSAGIEALVLKGAALAHLLYPQPGLRPMRDLDLLVKKGDARLAQTLLAELGFVAPLPPWATLPSKHLAAAKRYAEGLAVSVEIHHNLFSSGAPATELDSLWPSAIPFTVEGQQAYTLGYEDMLCHLYRHMRNIFQPLRLIWLADIVGWAERFAAQIDWPRVRRRCPQVLNLIRLCQTPGLMGEDFRGWPRLSLAAQQEKGYGGILRDTFFPSEWWLRLYYGAGSEPALFWHRWGRHPLHILGWLGHYGLGRVSHAFIR